MESEEAEGAARAVCFLWTYGVALRPHERRKMGTNSSAIENKRQIEPKADIIGPKNKTWSY